MLGVRDVTNVLRAGQAAEAGLWGTERRGGGWQRRVGRLGLQDGGAASNPPCSHLKHLQGVYRLPLLRIAVIQRRSLRAGADKVSGHSQAAAESTRVHSNQRHSPATHRNSPPGGLALVHHWSGVYELRHGRLIQAQRQLPHMQAWPAHKEAVSATWSQMEVAGRLPAYRKPLSQTWQL